MNKKDHLYYLRRANEIAKNSREHGNTPFGALLVDKDGNILLEQENIEISTGDCTGHAEASLMRRASQKYSKEFLAECTLYTTFEPCVMCSGAIYWGNVRTVVYGLTEKELLNQTGNDKQNPTFDLSCREVFKKGQKDITVIGPFNELKDEILKTHEGYWGKSD
ncbi:nucleoside deaminase [Clostridium autoethanogenum]|uniref:Nucleoside deaminase n=1 Tax=Clostridium autoethanogenum TaxID=84023 RepID=A0A3M0ST00_9CLOT|nr:nucleoside deaminase [Clostridium autoethanogenum]RMD01663.1 nucleoside deaminase [Clostridium autoethanogenum]